MKYTTMIEVHTGDQRSGYFADKGCTTEYV